ncbi:BTE_collapsed_G0004090.mRNA.1.CDS.1 [Saccharomyces cerevisiae]|nr:BTE_collapsed_G0004090.mRNA.1.CDS.1 [Saccharomyces cerevisiae]
MTSAAVAASFFDAFFVLSDNVVVVVATDTSVLSYNIVWLSLCVVVWIFLAFFCVVLEALILAPLNPNYKEKEFNFYLNDLKSKAICVPKGTTKLQSSEILKSASTFGFFLLAVVFCAPVLGIECYIFSREDTSKRVIYRSLNNAKFVNTNPVKFPGFARSSDVALILHTSGTTSTPKRLLFFHLTFL